MNRLTGGCLCGNVRIVAKGRPYRVGLCHCLDCRKHHGAIFARTADEIEVNLGSLDAPDQLMPTYESWIIRRESWLPPFPLTRRYDRDRDAKSRFEE